MRRKEFDEKVVALLEKLMLAAYPTARRSEPKHGIVGDPIADEWYELFLAAYDGVEE